MKRETSDNITYREIDHNGSRVKILDKNLYRIKYNNHHYIVPRANQSWGTALSIDLSIQHCKDGFYQDSKSGTLWFNENKMGNFIIDCKIQESINSADCEDIKMTIFREGDDNIVMQYALSKSYGSYHFIREYDCETLPDAGKYIAIVSGMQHIHNGYNRAGHYVIIPFTVCKGEAPQNTIVESAHYSFTSPVITGSTAPLKIDLVHNSTAYQEMVLTALCFDSEMNLVAHNNIVITAHKGNGSDHIAIKPDFFWIENERYTIVINDTAHTIATLTFTTNNEGECLVHNSDSVELIYRNTSSVCLAEYRLLQAVSGMSDMRSRMFMQMERTRQIEELNKKIEGLHLDTLHHSIIYTDFAYEKSPTLNRAYALSYVLMKKSAQIIDCEEVCNDNDYGSLFCDEEVSVWTNVRGLYKHPKKAWNYIKEYLDFDKQIILYDSKEAIGILMKQMPELHELFEPEYIYQSSCATAKEIAYRFFSEIDSIERLIYSEKAMQHIYHTLANKAEQSESLEGYNSTVVCRFLKNIVTRRAQKRILSMPFHKIEMIGKEVKCLQPEDLDFSFFDTPQEKKQACNECLGDLDSMIGLHKIKQEITALSTLLQFNQRRTQLGLKAGSTGCHHMIFTGSPGTGKTTVAKMIGKIFHNLGLLSTGNVIVTERSKILGRYIGETENNMQEIIEKAKGNVLFIDEAYTLCRNGDDTRDFGQHAIETLLTTLSEENSDILVILAGYKEEMDTMLSINTGLRGRFPHQWHFDNYSCDELMQIAYNTLQQEDYTLTPEADLRLREVISHELQADGKEFSNARWIKQYITHTILPAIAQRVIKLPHSNNTALYTTIEACDITDISHAKKSIHPTRNRIGFCTLQQYEVA